MAITNPARQFAHRRNVRALGPPLIFAAAVLLAFAPLGISTTILPSDLSFALSSATLLVIAASVALLDLSRGRSRRGSEVTYWDVAGALTLLGLCAAALVDPEQMVRLVEGSHHNN